MDIEIGSNLYRNTDGTIEIEGIPQVTLSIRPQTGTLHVNFALFDENGRLVAKIVESGLAFNERRAYELTTTETSLSLKHAESGKVILSLDKKGADRVVFKQGAFHSIKGHLFEVTGREWRIEKQQASGGNEDVQGGSVVIVHT